MKGILKEGKVEYYLNENKRDEIEQGFLDFVLCSLPFLLSRVFRFTAKGLKKKFNK